MRIIFVLGLFLLFLNCEDKQTKKKNSSKTKDSTTTVKQDETQKDAIAKDTLKHPVLDTKNAMEFFLQYDKENKENTVRLTTDYGSFDILLFEETKFHRANFIYLAKRKYYQDTQFYRVIDNFIIQGGSSDDRKTGKKRKNIGRYLLPVDADRGFKHDRGAISMPSSDIDNPHKLASPYEFFIVQQRGGAHFLDGDFTVFGRVIKGMDVVDKIAAVDTDEADWPLKNIYIKSVEIIN